MKQHRPLCQLLPCIAEDQRDVVRPACLASLGWQLHTPASFASGCLCLRARPREALRHAAPSYATRRSPRRPRHFNPKGSNLHAGLQSRNCASGKLCGNIDALFASIYAAVSANLIALGAGAEKRRHPLAKTLLANGVVPRNGNSADRISKDTRLTSYSPLSHVANPKMTSRD